MAFELDSISDINSAWQYFGTFAKTPQLELSCKKILFFPKCSRMWCVAMSTNCRHDFSTASGIDVTQLWPWSFWEAQKDLWDSASLPDTSREGVYVQISLSGLKPPHQAARTLWRASKCERLQCSILPCPRTSEGAWRGCWANPSAAHLHKEHPAGPVEATAQLRLSGVPAGASSRGNSTFGSAWLHIHLGWCEWLQVCCCGSTAGTSGAPAELCSREGAAPAPDKHPWHRLLLPGCGATRLSRRKGQGLCWTSCETPRELNVEDVHVHRRPWPPKMLKQHSRGLWTNKSLVLQFYLGSQFLPVLAGRRPLRM